MQGVKIQLGFKRSLMHPPPPQPMFGPVLARLFTLHYRSRQRQGDPQREHPQQHPLDCGSAVQLLSITLGLLIDSQ